MGSDNIYILLGDLLSMYAVNRSSITACWTGDVNKHLLTDSNKMINYAEIHVYWVDVECNICSARTLFFCVVPVMNTSYGQWKWSINGNKLRIELQSSSMPLWGSMPPCIKHAGAASPRQQHSDPSINITACLSSQHLMSTFRASASEEAASFQILKLCTVLCKEQYSIS